MTLESLQMSDYIQFTSAFLGAFFAFVFFALGHLWTSSRKERKNAIADIGRLQEFMAMQTYYFETNLLIYENLIKSENPIAINLSGFTAFPIEEYFFCKLNKYQVSLSLMRYIVDLKVLNADIESLNKWLAELTDFSRIAMLEQKEDHFRDTLTDSAKKFKEQADKLKSHLTSTKEEVPRILAELALTQDYLRSSIFRRFYIKLRTYFDDTYREERLKKFMNSTE